MPRGGGDLYMTGDNYRVRLAGGFQEEEEEISSSKKCG